MHSKQRMHSEQQSDPPAILQLWGLAQPSSRGPRARLSLSEIADESCALADEQGFDAITLASVAVRLNVSTTALYRYVDSKDTLLELMIDSALGSEPILTSDAGETADAGETSDAGGASDAGGVPDGQRVHRWVDAMWSRYLEHPWLANFPMRRAPRCPNAFGWLSGLVDALDDAGAVRPLDLALSIDVVTRGFAAVHEAAAESELTPAVRDEIARRHPNIRTEALSRPKIQLDTAVDALLQHRSDSSA